MQIAEYVDVLNLLADESRLRLCALLSDRELCVTDLVRVTGMAQSRVSTHLGRLKDAGFVHDRRQGTQTFYGLVESALPAAAQAVLADATKTGDPIIAGDLRRLLELEAGRRGGTSESATDDLERYYSPGRTWQSLAAGIAGFLELGDVLDAGAGDGAAAAALAPYCKSLRCIDINQRQIDVARSRFAKLSHVKVQVADVHAMPFDAASFDGVLLFHTLTHATDPPRVLRECSRVLRPGGRLVILCLDRHEQRELTARYGEIHPGFAPRDLRRLLTAAELEVKRAQVAAREDKKTRLDVVLAVAQKPINTQS